MNTQDNENLLHELSELCGIIPEYWDIFGKKQIPSLETKRAILRAMNLDIDTDEDIQRAILEKRNKSWKSFIEPVCVVSINEQPFVLPLHIPLDESQLTELCINFSVEDEHGQKNDYALSGDACTVSEKQRFDNTQYVKIILHDTAHRQIGYYNLDVECRIKEGSFSDGRNIISKKSKLIITPDTCYTPQFFQYGRAWGLAVNLYAVRSARNYGAGDLSDLRMIVDWIANLKGDFVGINPLHVLPNTQPFGISPYSPISRLYKNFIYIDIDRIPEVSEAKNRNIFNNENVLDRIEILRELDTVNYDEVARIKEGILKTAFALFYSDHYLKGTNRGLDFREYVSDEGYPLLYFATFMAIASHQSGGRDLNWKEWPYEYQNIKSDAIRRFQKEHKEEILFHQYVQWLIDRHQREVAENAERAGMRLGLYQDLAIGSVVGGSDVWSYPDVIAHEADVGAPPDDFNPHGQKWGFPPMIPEKLKETGYELFIQTMQKNMKHSGALRIDHALGLFRLFWVPKGMSPKEGAYVEYPSEDLLRIIALESVRNRTVIIAEDLGTIGKNVREALKNFQMLSYRLFYFERNYPDPSFLKPEEYPELALCAVTTHDLPTLYGYWTGRDLEIKRQLGHYSDDDFWQSRLDERERDKKLILTALDEQTISYGNNEHKEEIEEMTVQLCQAIYQYLARTPSKLLLISLDDIIGTINQQNMPGTVDSYPNWMQKIPILLEKIVSDKRFQSLAETFQRENRIPSDL
jgi:4-alpha-glucanotransferase